jgi:hypothetical protein
MDWLLKLDEDVFVDVLQLAATAESLPSHEHLVDPQSDEQSVRVAHSESPPLYMQMGFVESHLLIWVKRGDPFKPLNKQAVPHQIISKLAVRLHLYDCN